jgi:hypothetical protein
MLVRALPTHFPPNVSLAGWPPRTPVAQLTALVLPAYEPDRSLESPSLIEVVRTLFVTESRLVDMQFWRGRLRLVGFVSNDY